MATAVSFTGVNKVLGPPSGVTEEQVSTLPVFCNGVVCVSCWELSPEEMLQIMATRRVWISIYSGATQPPVHVGSEDEVRAVAVDYGPVWPRSET